MNVKKTAEEWGISERRVRELISQGKVEGVIKEGRAYMVPVDAVKPVDGRAMRGMNIPVEYNEIFARVDSLKEELDRRRPFTEGEIEQLRKEFTIEFTYDSNAIEGSTLTLQETAMVLEGVTIDQKPLKEHLEAVGHRDAFLYIEELVKDKVVISERVIKEIHSLVLMDRPDDKGRYRRISVRIMGAHHEPPEPHLVPLQMEALLAEKNKRHPIENAALFHLDFEGIHPFIDGNGRTGRLIMNLMLMQDGYPPINVKFADRRRYYSCFDEYFKGGSSKPLVMMMSEYLEENLKTRIALTR